MRLDESKINPLYGLLDSIPDKGVELTHSELSRIALFLNSGGVFCEDFHEVMKVLEILQEVKLVTIIKEAKTLKLYKVKYV